MTKSFFYGDKVRFNNPSYTFYNQCYEVLSQDMASGNVHTRCGLQFKPANLDLVESGAIAAPLRAEPTPDPKPNSQPAYPDGNPKSAQGAKKHALSYMPTAAIVAANEAFADGRAKYGAANWREKGVSNMVYIEAAMRHLALYADGGEEIAADSGAKHLGHAIACLAIILDADSCGVLQDHRPAPNPNLAKILSKEAK